MAQTTTGTLNEMLSGGAPLTDVSGKTLAPAKTGTTGTPNWMDAATIVRDRNGKILLGGAIINPQKSSSEYETSRIGDYVYDTRGNATVVPNSYRDLVNKYVVRTGESAYKGLGVYDYATALSKGISAALGIPTDSSSVGSMLATGAVGQAVSGNAYLRPAWIAANIGKSLLDAEKEARDKYLNQEIDYDIALDFSTDENGNIVATPNYKKMGTAGHGSGESVLEAVDTESSNVSLSKDNQLDINVSDAFANSSSFNELLDFFRNNYSSLTKEQANRVVDEDTGRTLIQTIEQDVKSAESSFYYNAKSIQAFKEIAPAASDEALDQAAYTQLAGYVSDDSLSKMSIVVYNDNNEREEVNAKEYLDFIKNKSKSERNDYMNSLGSRIQNNSISDDEKVVLQAQANALYAASDKDGAYSGMYKKDFLDSLGDVPVPIFTQMTLGELFAEPFGGYTNLDTFETNEWFAGLFQIASTLGEAFAISKMANGLEKLGRKGIEALGKGALSGTKFGTALSKINTYAPQDVRFLAPGAELTSKMELANTLSATPMYQTTEASLKGAGSWLGKTAIQNGMQLAADAAVEGLRYGVYEIYGKGDRFDYLDELQADLLFDALMTYGPRNYVTRTKGKKLKAFDVDERIEEVDEDGRPTGEVFTIPGVRVEEVDADEVARKHAERIDKLTDSNLALKTQELLFDRNAAFGKMAVQIRSVVTGDNYLYRKMLRMGNDIRQLTQDTHSRFNQTFSADLDSFMSKLSDAAPKVRDWTKADRDYLNAAAQSYRFSKIHEGDEAAQKEISAFYSKALNGVSEDRKAQLDELLAAGRKLASDVLQFYKDNDIISEAAKKEVESKPEYTGGMFFPVWQKSKRISGGETTLGKAISQERPVLKSVFSKDELIRVDDLEDPLVTLSQYLQNAARNVAINERALTIREAGSIPGMKLHIASDTGDALSDVENLKELSDTFAKKYDSIVKKSMKEYPTREEWQKSNDKLVLKSAGLKLADELNALNEEAVKLRKEARNARRAFSEIPVVATDNDYPGFYIDERVSIREDSSDILSHLDMSPDATDDGDAISYNRKKGKGTMVVEMSPQDYLELLGPERALDNEEARRAREEFGGAIKRGETKAAIPYLTYDEKGKLDKQEGRHRAHALIGAGIEKMPVAIDYHLGAKPTELGKFADVTERFVYNRPGVDEALKRVVEAEIKLEDNKQAQLHTIDRIKDSAGELMREAQGYSKNADTKLDIDSYLNIQVTNNLKKALKANNATAQIQVTLSDAVEKANPFVDPASIVQSRAEEAASEYRKSVNKKLKMRKKTTGDKLNAIADKVMDSIEEKVMGAKAGVKVIDDAEATRILNSSGDSHTIRYLLDGTEYRMTLTGPGSERLVAEFYAPEFWQPTGFWRTLGKKTLDAGGKLATAKRVLTSSMDIGKVLPNLARDWSRGIVTSGGQILLSPDMVRDWALSQGEASPERTRIVNDGFELVREAIDRSTLTESLEVPKKNRAKTMVRAANEPDGNGFTRFVYERGESPIKALSTLQDVGESFTRIRAMEIAYYRALGEYFAKGLSDTGAVKRATEAAYMAGRETTTNFFRRGKLIAAIARNVPYFSQNFATLESFKYSFLDDPIAVTRALQDTTFAYTALIAIALSNDESRQKYFLLSEYDRSHNIIIPLANDTIITIPLDETMAAFLTPWRREVETLAGVDPEAFYMTFLETFEALSPFDLEGFSEGDKFNLVRGLEKLGSQMIPTWAQPLVEAMTGRDLYYGSTLAVTQDDIGQQTGDWNATPGQLTTKSKNSQALAEVSERTGIPQWILQNMLSEYGGSIGQYALNTIDKLAGATEGAQGGKEWSDSIFKPFTGSDSNQVNQAFWDGISQLKDEKKSLQRELKTLKNQIAAATGEEKAVLQQKRQDKINAYGTKVSDFLSQYLSAYEITGGLSKTQANQVWYLYKIYDDDANADMYDTLSTGEYYSEKQKTYNNRRATGLAAASGIDRFIDPAVAKADTLAKNGFDPTSNYADTYGRQAHLNSIYGDATRTVYRLETALKEAGFPNRSKMYEEYNAVTTKAEKKQAKANWNAQVLLAIAPTVEEVGLDTILGSSEVLDYLQKWLFDFTVYNRKQYLRKVFGG